jgi:hypothetical protein
VAETRLLGNGTTSIPATNAVFGDPCGGTLKDCLASYAEPLLAGLQLQYRISTRWWYWYLFCIYGVGTTMQQLDSQLQQERIT